MARSIAGAVFVILAIVLLNVWREYGSAGVRSWFSAKMLNRPTITRSDRKAAA